MANEERLVPVSLNEGGQLTPLVRRTLTVQTQENPTRYDAGALIAFTPDEVRQLSSWTQNASLAISQVGQTLLTLPGETRISSTETRDTQETTGSQSTSATQRQEEVRGFAFISFYMNSQSTTNQQNRGNTTRESREARDHEEVARVRPGQFLTGHQVEDALHRVAIARGEGLLFLPAAHSELTRQQQTLVETTRRTLEDHRKSSPTWADDIQDGVITGLVEQLEQANGALKNGYIPEEIGSEVSAEARQTIHDQLVEVQETTFTSLLEVILQDGGRQVALGRAASTLQNVVLEAFEQDPDRAIGYLRTWYEIFSQRATGERALTLGSCFANTLTHYVFLSQDDEQTATFEGLSQIVSQTSKAGGALYLLGSLATETVVISPAGKTIELYSSLVDDIPNKNTAEALTTLIRVGLIGEESEEQNKRIYGLLSRLTYVNDVHGYLIPITLSERNGIEVQFATIATLTEALTPEEWQKMRRLLKPDDEAQWAVRRTYGVPQQIPLATLKDPEIILAAQQSFRATLDRFMTEIPFNARHLSDSDISTLAYQFRQLDSEDQVALKVILNETALRAERRARGFIRTRGGIIVALANLGSLVNRSGLDHHGRDNEALDAVKHILHHDSDVELEGDEVAIDYMESQHHSRISRLRKLFDHINAYRSSHYWAEIKEKENSWNPITRRNYARTVQARDAVFTDESNQLRIAVSSVDMFLESLKRGA